MSVGVIIELMLLAVAGIALLSTLMAAIRFGHGPRKGAYKTSWFEK